MVSVGDYLLELLVENCGRINYVKTLEWIMQKKGLGPENQLTVSGGEFTSGIDVTGMPFLADWVTRLVSQMLRNNQRQDSHMEIYSILIFFRSILTVRSGFLSFLLHKILIYQISAGWGNFNISRIPVYQGFYTWFQDDFLLSTIYRGSK